MKQVWGMILSYLRIWSIPFKNQDWELVDRIEADLIKNMKIFRRWWCRFELHFLGRISTWKTTSFSSYTGCATEAYVMEHPEETMESMWWSADCGPGARWKLCSVLSYSVQSFVSPLLPVMNGIVRASSAMSPKACQIAPDRTFWGRFFFVSRLRGVASQSRPPYRNLDFTNLIENSRIHSNLLYITRIWTKFNETET
jgi:hypothetical protein